MPGVIILTEYFNIAHNLKLALPLKMGLGLSEVVSNTSSKIDSTEVISKEEEHQVMKSIFILSYYSPCSILRDFSDMSLVVRKPVFGVFDQVRHKPGCTIIEDG